MSRFLSLEEVVLALAIEPEFVHTLEREGIVVCDEDGYPIHVVERIRVCWSLHHDLGVNLPGIEVALNLLDQLAVARRARQG